MAKTQKKIREEILNMTVGDLIACWKDGLMAADKNGSTLAIVAYAHRINVLEEAVDLMVSAEMEMEV